MEFFLDFFKDFNFSSFSTDTHEGCETCLDVLQALENIDDDAERQNIKLVKTTDVEFSESIGITEFPSLVFYKDAIPNMFDGDISAEEEVLDWLIEMNVENHIELITRPMLENMVEEFNYLAVYFCKYFFFKLVYQKSRPFLANKTMTFKVKFTFANNCRTLLLTKNGCQHRRKTPFGNNRLSKRKGRFVSLFLCLL